jgi:hypothetical protein
MASAQPQTEYRPTVAASSEAPRLTFGIFPGLIGTEEGLVGQAPRLRDPARTDEALGRLQAPGRPFLVRGYVLYTGAGRAEYMTPEDLTHYVRGGRRGDCVLCFRPPDGDLDDWERFVRQAVRRYGPHLEALQVAEEPNNPNAAAGGDGGFPRVRQAVVAGVIAAKDEARRQGLNVRVGFNATPSFDPADNFWQGLATRISPAFLDALDYVGLDFFPDVFRPVAPADLRPAVEGVLTHFRNVNLAASGIPASVPVCVTENGWPTGPGRPDERQADVLETVVRAVHGLRAALNITHYEFFALRDPDSSTPAPNIQFGLLRDDYTPKPAFDRFRGLIAELGA